MKDIRKVDAEIISKTNRINEIEQQIEQLDSEKIELQKMVDDLKIDKATNEVLQSIFRVTTENSLQVYLTHDTKTTPIIDKFYSSDRDFLIFENAFYFSNTHLEASLVVTKSTEKVNFADSNLTMTVLKQNVHTMISENMYFYKDNEDRMKALGDELAEVYKKNKNKKGLVPFKIPCLLGGQTYFNQTDLGREQYGDYVYKDKRYGETTKFLIIGVKVN